MSFNARKSRLGLDSESGIPALTPEQVHRARRHVANATEDDSDERLEIIAMLGIHPDDMQVRVAT